MTAPELSRRDLEKPVRQLIDAGRKRFLLAFHGRPDKQLAPDDELDVDGKRVRVIAVRSELDLRRCLLRISRDQYAAFLIPWRGSLPLDLQSRFARDGKIQMVGREERLYARFGVSEVDEDVSSSALAEYVLAHHAADAFSFFGGRLTLDALWVTYLSQIWNLDAGELALDSLLGWAAADARGPSFVTTMKDRASDVLRTALLAHLESKLGALAPMIWTAWERGQGSAMLELGLVLGALAGSTDRGVEVWIQLTAKQLFGVALDASTLARLGEISDLGFRFLTRRDSATSRALLLAADQRAADPTIVAHVAGSTRLPSAWRARLDKLGDALTIAAATPTAATVQVAVAAKRDVWNHEMARDSEQTTVLRRAEMALSLASWLAVRPDRELPSATTDYGDVETLATWYATEGGFIDHARRFARGGADSRFARGVQAIVTQVDEIRLELDRRFARALAAWHRAGRRATEAVPIDTALQRLGTSFLDEESDRRLLVVLMDGMAWSQAVELLLSMGDRASVWGPLAWHGMTKHRVGEGPYPPVLTNLPTITEVSRSAFFGGKPIPPGATTNASLDTEKWKANRDVIRNVSSSVVPQLKLRGDGQAKDGSASPDALELVLDPSQRIVAVVINAIDMSLKADRTHDVEWTINTVKSLRDLLDKATEAGRAVLLCSDHGHVLADLMESSPKNDSGGARWRVWQNPSDAIAEYEVGLPAGEGVWAPKGAHGIVMISDDRHRYGGGTGSGEHGGASLAEVVAPCVLIGCADVPAATDDKGQAVRPAVPPNWWFFDVGISNDAEPTPEERTKKPRKTTKRPISDQQQVFATIVPPPVAPPPVIAVARTITRESKLAASELFRTRATDPKTRQQTVRAVEFLRARKGIAASAAFAAELGEFVSRVQGVVAKLQEVLNVDGYQVLRYDRQNQQVHLDLEKLAQQFDIAF